MRVCNLVLFILLVKSKNVFFIGSKIQKISPSVGQALLDGRVAEGGVGIGEAPLALGGAAASAALKKKIQKVEVLKNIYSNIFCST